MLSFDEAYRFTDKYAIIYYVIHVAQKRNNFIIYHPPGKKYPAIINEERYLRSMIQLVDLRTFCRLSIVTISLLLLGQSCQRPHEEAHTLSLSDAATEDDQKLLIGAMIDSFHADAGQADFEAYFAHMTDDAIFIGTDATEHWDMASFKRFSKPYFDKGKAWNFTSIERHIYLSPQGNLAWFDELLNTQMKICRGSGVAVWQNNRWKISHYTLSMTVPNALSDTVVIIKTPIENALIDSLTRN